MLFRLLLWKWISQAKVRCRKAICINLSGYFHLIYTLLRDQPLLAERSVQVYNKHVIYRGERQKSIRAAAECLNSNWHQFTRIQSKCALVTMSCQRSCLSWHTCECTDAGHGERKKYEAKRCSSDNKSRHGIKAGACFESRAIDITGGHLSRACTRVRTL